MKKVGFYLKLFTSLLLLLLIVQFFTASVALSQSTYDVNKDGKVDILDILAWGQAFGTKSGETDFNSAADVNGDGVIDIMDAVLISLHFGE